MLDTYVGQRDALAPLIAAIASSRATGRAMPNMLFLGGPGRGKTTLAKAVAEEVGKKMVTLHGSSTIERQGIADKIIDAQGNILFIDEIHALPRQISEELYRVIDEGRISITVPKTEVQWVRATIWANNITEIDQAERWLWHGPGYYNTMTPKVKTLRETETQLMQLSPITIIGATTDEALLPEPFYSRLSALTVRLRPYTMTELMDIAVAHARSLNVDLTPMAAETIAQRSRQTPRRVKHLTERAADLTIAEGLRTTQGSWLIQHSTANKALVDMGVDQKGLEEPHRAILRLLASNERGMSRTSLAQSVGIPPRNLDQYWGDLVALGLVSISTRHEITEEGRRAL